MTCRITRLLCGLLLALLLAGSLQAQSASAPELINVQGKLSDASGVPVNGQAQFTFVIFDAEVSGNELWREGPLTLTLTRGIYNVLLGSTATLPSTIFTSGSSRYLEITVNGETLTPRQRIVSAAYVLAGNQGMPGPKGDQGNSGPAGLQGLKGDRGDKGDKGGKGDKGDKGDQGDQGDKGGQGDKGDKGDQGSQGPAGGISKIESAYTFDPAASAAGVIAVPNSAAFIAGQAVVLSEPGKVPTFGRITGIPGSTSLEFTPGTDVGDLPTTTVSYSAGKAVIAIIGERGAAAKLNDGSVTTSLLADAAITSAKIASGAVSTVNIADGAITASKLAAGAITTVTLADAVITSSKIADGAITSAKIADGTITGADIAPATISASRIIGGSGSGLDADTVDGKHASDFAPVSGSVNYAPASGSASYIQNGSTPQAGNFNVSGSGIIGTNLAVGGDLIVTGKINLGGALVAGNVQGSVLTSTAANGTAPPDREFNDDSAEPERGVCGWQACR